MPVKAFAKIQLLLLPMALCIQPAPAAEPPKKPAPKPRPAKSVFIMPTSPKEGRDPFFPDSTRVYEVGVADTAHAQAVEITSLKVKGYSIVNGQPMIIINNHTFTIHDEGDVLTSSGRVHVRCLDIRPNVVILEANGQRQDLHF